MRDYLHFTLPMACTVLVIAFAALFICFEYCRTDRIEAIKVTLLSFILGVLTIGVYNFTLCMENLIK